MPDITMCKDEACPSRSACWRYEARPSPWQSYFAESPRRGDVCEQHWPIKRNTPPPKDPCSEER